MTPLVKKEIRLLLPSWLALLSLAAVLPWVWASDGSFIGVMPMVSFFGTALIALDSFGREFSLGTFSSLMSQPLERRIVWRTKIRLLIAAVAVFFCVQLSSYWAWFYCWLPFSGANHWISPGHDWPQWLGAMLALTLAAATGALWTVMLIRQIAAAFWITFLAPAGILVLVMLCLPPKLESNEYFLTTLLYTLAAIYSAASFWFARRMFHNAQDVGWAGGIVAFSKWRYFESGSTSVVSLRQRRPLVALVKKEFQLQSISWFCAAALLVLHLAIIAIRYAHGKFERDSLAGVASEFYLTVWLIMPIIIGCTVMAEERRLGTMEGQACLPASRRLQFALKFFLAVFSGILLGGVVPMLLEGFAVLVGAPNPDFRPYAHSGAAVAMTGLALGLSLAGCYASTLTKSFLQAMGIAVVVIVGAAMFTTLAANAREIPGVVEWNPFLTMLLAVLTVLVVAPVLTYRNYKFFQEPGRTWRRNVFGLVGAALFIFASSAALYNRAWEVFRPAEPAHGEAKLSISNPPVIHSDNRGGLTVQLPDGRVWSGSVGHHHSGFIRDMVHEAFDPLPDSVGPQQFFPGSNWMSLVVRQIDIYIDANTRIRGQLETVGIQKDGTLWILDKPASPKRFDEKFTQFGVETNWQALSWSQANHWVLLLKNDGTLWCWGTNRVELHTKPEKWPALRNSSPVQIGTDSNWKDISFNHSYAQKADGSTWLVWWHLSNRFPKIDSATNFDQVDFTKFSRGWDDSAGAKILQNGTLWFWHHQWGKNYNNPPVRTYQCGSDTNWNYIAGNAWWNPVALKSDGTLWRCFNPGRQVNVPLPTRLGIHNDWVAIASTFGNVVALAADGSLWLWPQTEEYWDRQLLKLPKQPKLLGNVFVAGQ